MKNTLFSLFFFLICSPIAFAQQHVQHHQLTSPYLNETNRKIKSLSQDDIQKLNAGAGTALGGLAKAAELNGYPGPRHVLDAVESLALTLSESQIEKTQTLFEDMQQKSKVLGIKLIDAETKLDRAFSEGSITETSLEEITREIGLLMGELRATHLKAHLEMMKILDADQIRKYNELRGYTNTNDPCENIPEGHDPVMWRKHNGCNN